MMLLCEHPALKANMSKSGIFIGMYVISQCGIKMIKNVKHDDFRKLTHSFCVERASRESCREIKNFILCLVFTGTTFIFI